jgi:hypothetical protein
MVYPIKLMISPIQETGFESDPPTSRLYHVITNDTGEIIGNITITVLLGLWGCLWGYKEKMMEYTYYITYIYILYNYIYIHIMILGFISDHTGYILWYIVVRDVTNNGGCPKIAILII